MALTDQPYFPFYVDDYLTDEKLLMCDPASEGVYNRIICHLHKSDDYGRIIINEFEKAKLKQKLSKTQAKYNIDFLKVYETVFLMYVEKVKSLTGRDYDVVFDALVDLIKNKVLIIQKGELLNNTNHFNKKSLYQLNKPLWVKIINKVFKRDNYTCKYCGAKGKNVILEADHIKPKSKGGSDDLENLNTSCRKCNRKKSNKSLEEFLNQIK